MAKQLTEVQVATLVALKAAGDWRSAYPGLKLGTLRSLQARGLVVSKGGLGSMAFPANCIDWRLTMLGSIECAKHQK